MGFVSFIVFLNVLIWCWIFVKFLLRCLIVLLILLFFIVMSSSLFFCLIWIVVVVVLLYLFMLVRVFVIMK